MTTDVGPPVRRSVPFDARLAILLILLIGFALRIFRLDYQELRGDEAFGYFFSLRPFADMIAATLRLQEPHPIAGYLVQKASLAINGHSEFGLRIGGVVFGTLAVALIYRLGRQMSLSKTTALVAAALLAISPYAIWHSQDARMYSMSLALTVASTWLALTALSNRRWTLWLAYLLVSLLALHTHYYNAFVIVAQNVFVFGRALVNPRVRARLMTWFGIQVVLGLLFLPWLLLARETLTSYGGNGDSPGLIVALHRALSAFAVGGSMPGHFGPLIGLIAGLLLVLGALRMLFAPARPDDDCTFTARDAFWLSLLLLVVPLGAIWLAAQNRPIFDERYLVVSAPPFFLLLAAALTPGAVAGESRARDGAARSRVLPLVSWAMAALALVLMLTSLRMLYFDPAYSKTRGWRELATVLERSSQGLPPEQVRLVQNFPDPTLWYYYDGQVDHLVLPPQPQDVEGTMRAVEALVDGGVRRVLFAEQAAPWWDAERIAPRVLGEHYGLLDQIEVGVWPVHVYARAAPETLAAREDSFVNGVALVGAAVEPDGAALAADAGGIVVVHLKWAGSAQALQGTEKIFLHIVGEGGTPLAQADRPFEPDQLNGEVVSYAIRIPDGMAGGEYRLLAGLYDPALAGAPRIFTTAGDDSIPLAVVSIRREAAVISSH